MKFKFKAVDKCPVVSCESCGDAMVHQSKRRSTESSSAYGQHIFDDYTHSFFFCDVDGVVYKRDTRILRVIEHKLPSKKLKPSQTTILSLFADAVASMIRDGNVDAQSGVFVINITDPWETGLVTEIRDKSKMEKGVRCLDRGYLTGDRLRAFETGMPVNWDYVKDALAR